MHVATSGEARVSRLIQWACGGHLTTRGVVLQIHNIVDLNYILAVPWAAADLNVMFPGTKCALICQ